MTISHSKTKRSPTRNLALSLLFSAAFSLGCGDSSNTASVQISIGAEDTIPDGLSSGGGDENIVDGYNIVFDNYILSIGNITLAKNGGDSIADDTVMVIDLTRVPANGRSLTTLEGIPSGRWDLFGYELPAPSTNAINDISVSTADFDRMVTQGLSYLIRGRIVDDGGTPNNTADDGAVFDRAFEIASDEEARFSQCQIEDAQGAGLDVPRAGTTAELTIHGDHIFFSAFPDGAESIMRRAAWLTQIADIDNDNQLTRVDFEAATDLGTIFPASDYSLSGSPISPLHNAWDFIEGQLLTQGHFFGEGECEFGRAAE